MSSIFTKLLKTIYKNCRYLLRKQASGGGLIIGVGLRDLLIGIVQVDTWPPYPDAAAPDHYGGHRRDQATGAVDKKIL